MNRITTVVRLRAPDYLYAVTDTVLGHRLQQQQLEAQENQTPCGGLQCFKCGCSQEDLVSNMDSNQ